MDTKIAVFLCNCGGAIKNIDFEATRERISKIPGVTSVDLSSGLCFEEGKREMVSRIREEHPDRVVVAGCAPEFSECVFQQVLETAGLSGRSFSAANIREQCSWVHDGDVTGKAVELVKMAVSRVRLLRTLEKKELPVSREVLVVGGGFSAIGTALRLSRIGLPVTIAAVEEVLGATQDGVESFYRCDIDTMKSAVEGDRNIEVLTPARVTSAHGEAGDFAVTIEREGERIRRKYGAIVLATGFTTELSPVSVKGLPVVGGAGSPANIVSQEQLFRMLDNGATARKPETIAFLLDSCDENSRFPTLATLNNAIAARVKWGSEVYVFCKDVKVDSEGAEKLYREARGCGVVFVKCDSAPRLAIDDGRISIEARDVFLGADTIVDCDLLVAEEVLCPPEGTEALADMFNIRLDSRGFYQDENVHLYPVGFEKRGVFCVGGCRGDLEASRMANDIHSVAMMIYGLLSSGVIEAEIERVKADTQKCVACLTCIRVCPHSAIRLSRVDNGKEIAVISDVACDACGICAAICPAKAIVFEGYRDDQVLAQIEAIGES